MILTVFDSSPLEWVPSIPQNYFVRNAVIFDLLAMK